jgi:hypothetical protein
MLNSQSITKLFMYLVDNCFWKVKFKQKVIIIWLNLELK